MDIGQRPLVMFWQRWIVVDTVSRYRSPFFACKDIGKSLEYIKPIFGHWTKPLLAACRCSDNVGSPWTPSLGKGNKSLIARIWKYSQLSYLCSKGGVLGFYKQATHRRPGDEPFFHFRVHRSWLGMAQKWSILDQKWQACQRSKVVQKGPKWSN